jgi:TorA maturation chaperone TorD
MISREFLEIRLGIYRLLHALYDYPPCEEKLNALLEINLPGDIPYCTALKDLQDSIGGLDLALLEEQLKIEMTRLMEGPGLPSAPPYASYYLNNKQLMGSSAQDARRAYLEWQVAPEQDSIPADHISLELGFLAYLAERAIQTQGSAQLEALNVSLSFLSRQLLTWEAQFCAAVEANSHEPFFIALARFTTQVIEADLVWLRETLSFSEPISLIYE